MTPIYLLDTDIVSYAIKQKPFAVCERLAYSRPNDLAISVIAYSELLHGAIKSGRDTYFRSLIEGFISRVHILDWSEKAAENFARIRHDLTITGKPIGILDMQIAAHALALDCTLVTNNTKHFSQIKNLKIENWAL